jgi:hypothetical protein
MEGQRLRVNSVIGTTTPGATLEVNGTVKVSGSSGQIIFPDGSVQSTAWTATTVLCGGDFAESVDVAGSLREYEPGDLLVLTEDSDIVAAVYLQANDEAHYTHWKDMEKIDCKVAGLPR